MRLRIAEPVNDDTTFLHSFIVVATLDATPPITRWDHLLMGQRDKNGSLVEYYSQSGTLGKYVAMEDFRLQIPNGMLQ